MGSHAGPVGSTTTSSLDALKEGFGAWAADLDALRGLLG